MRFLAILACAAVLALAACSRPADEPPAAKTAAEPPAPAASEPAAVAAQGDTASAAVDAPKPEFPQLKLDTLDGKPYDLAAQRGHWVVVNFWATWCKPCLKEMPDLSALHAAGGDIRVLGLAYEDTTAQELKQFLAQRPVSYPIAIVDVYAPPADFDTPRGLPMTYLISPQGRVAQRFLGPVSSQEIRAAVASGGKAGASP